MKNTLNKGKRMFFAFMLGLLPCLFVMVTSSYREVHSYIFNWYSCVVLIAALTALVVALSWPRKMIL
jgi:hypothetical protein